jgi:hypothetical protein
MSDQLVLNEVGEIGRILFNVCQRIDKGQDFDDAPDSFRLGAGHQLFFYNKIDFVLDRYIRLREEFRRRYEKEYSKEHLKEFMSRYAKIKRLRPDLCGWYIMTPMDEESVLKRIQNRSQGYKISHTYYGSEFVFS